MNLAAAAHEGGGGEDDLAELGTEGLGEFDVDCATALGAFERGGRVEERGHAAEGAVDDLIGHDQIARGDVLLQGADGAAGQNPLAAETLEGKDVGTIRNVRRGEGVADAVAGEEGDRDAVEIHEDGVGRGRAEGGIDGAGFCPPPAAVELGEEGIAKAGAADDTDAFFHGGEYTGEDVERGGRAGARRRRD